MGDKGLELAAERVPLDPIDHETTETRTGRYTVIRVDVGDIVTNVFPAFDEVDVR